MRGPFSLSGGVEPHFQLILLIMQVLLLFLLAHYDYTLDENATGGYINPRGTPAPLVMILSLMTRPMGYWVLLIGGRVRSVTISFV